MITTQDFADNIVSGIFYNGSNISTSFSKVVEVSVSGSGSPGNNVEQPFTFVFSTNITQPQEAGGDTTNPQIFLGINISTTISEDKTVNISCNATDDIGLSNISITHNFSKDTGGGDFYRSILNFSASGTSFDVYNVSNIDGANGDVFNISCYAYDTSGNTKQSDIIVSFTTANDCTYVSGNWEIDDGNVCTLSTSLDIRPNRCRVQNGRLNILPSGRLMCGGCFANLITGGFFVDKLGGLFCG